MRFRTLLALFCLALLLVGWRVSSVLNSPLSVPTVSAQGAPNCSIIGNNLAIPFGGKSVGNFSESTHTLALLTGWADVPAIVEAINNSSKTVIIRLGAGKAAAGPPAADYVNILNQIAGSVSKPFIATAGHNEPNCAEYIPLADEVSYVQTVASGVTASNVTLITGQIDHYCGDANLPAPREYIQALTTIPNIKGLALPFYITNGTPDAATSVALFNQAAGLTSLPIYVTESGPLKDGSMREFITAVPQVLANTRIQSFLLFNALGLNPDAAFVYTKPFWNPRCREALRTKCQDTEAVIAACGSGDVDDYYLYPINGLATRDRPTIFNDLVNQGYEAQCSTPAFYTEAQEGGQISRLKELVQTGQASIQNRELEADLNVSYVTSTVPVWRDSNPIATLMNSLEDYWGHQDLEPSVNGLRNLNTAPIYSLLTVQQQCQAKIEILENIESLCSKLEDPTACALYRPIPGATAYDTQTVLPAWRQSGLTCEQISLGTYDKTAHQALVTAVQNTPLYLENAYRLAFVVMATELRDQGPLSYFNFLRRENASAMPKHEVRVVAFKIPDIGTNRVLDGTAYTDPLQRTRNSLITGDQIEKNRQTAIEEREALKVAPGPEALPVLECGGASCSDPLVASLIQMINNQQAQCKLNPEDLKYEASDLIQSSGTLTSGPGTQFADGSDPAGELFVAPSTQVGAPQTASFNFLARLGLGGTGDSNAQTQVFLIYPMGYELGRVEETLLAFFDREWGDTYADKKKVKDFFKVGGVAQTMTGGKATADFFDPNQECIFVPEANVTYCSRAEVELKTDLTNKEPRVLGGRLGYLTRTIQQTLHEITTPTLTYLKSCKTTEEFLMGICKGSKDPVVPSGPGNNLTPVAQCQAGGSRITSGEDAVHIPAPSNATCNIYDAGQHNIPNWQNPNDPVMPCEELFSFAACTYPNTLLANTVGSDGKFTNNGAVTACQYIVDQARASGISPRFALAMWGEESGFSHYLVPDFGVISQPAQDLGAQFSSFRNIVKDFPASGYLGFLERYSGEDRGSGTFCNNRYFPGRLKVYYDYLGP